jgi:hypothetical protein
LYIDDYSPPEFEKAEALYSMFSEKYPESNLRRLVEDTLLSGYQKHSRWEDMLRFCTPEFKKYTERGERPNPLLIFYYSEANLNLGNMNEAEEGYGVLVELFPESNEGKKAKKRLEELKGQRERNHT